MSTYSQQLWHPYTHPNEMKTRQPIHILSGDGVYVKDDQGRRLLDANAGGLWCVSVGYNHPEMRDAIVRQLEELTFYQLFDGTSHPRATELAAKLIGLSTLERMRRVFFTSGGSDSIETALKLARQYHVLNGEPERKKVISLKGAYHGAHYGAATLSAQTAMHRLYEPMLPGVMYAEMPFLYRNPWRCDDPEQLVSLCIDQLVRDIDYESPDTIAAIVAEPVHGQNLVVPPASYWPKLREVCDRYGILLVSDEVITGFGRSGALFGCRHWGVVPDMMCLAKCLTSGYVPLGAVLIGDRLEQAWDAVGEDPKGYIATGLTYSGHPVACAAGIAALDILEKENLVDNARRQGEYLFNRLRPFVERFHFVGDVRGKGLMIAIDFVKDKKSREPVDTSQKFSRQVAAVGRENGILVRPSGHRLMVSPALVYTSSHCDELADGLEKTLSQVDK